MQNHTNQNIVHVAVGVIKADDTHILISRRPAHLHQGGLWEFPGGKVDPGETVQQALARELHEEIGIDVIRSQPLIQIPYDYGDKQVLLDVYVVDEFAGQPHGKEAQDLEVVTIADLGNYNFPAANRGIVTALQLPQYYMITREFPDVQSLIASAEHAIANGVRLIQFRDHTLDEKAYLGRFYQLQKLCQQYHVILLANTTVDNFGCCDADGLHLSSRRLLEYTHRPVSRSNLFGGSVHDEAQLRHALSIDVDFVVLSPVKKTVSHPDAVPLGWECFEALTRISTVPVFALGGMVYDDMALALAHGGQGIAGISLFV